MEEWFRQTGAEYAYMATEQDNEASVRLFTGRCGYAKFRTLSVLVHPVFGHALRPSRRAAIVWLKPREAELLYRWHFAGVEFFPADIDAVLSNDLSLGTFLAVPAGARWEGVEAFLAAPPPSWAVLSVWNCMDAFRLEVRGAPRLMRAAAGATRLVDRAAPWLGIPTIPNLFAPFGLYFLYGLGGAGADAPRLARALCRHAHNMARVGAAAASWPPRSAPASPSAPGCRTGRGLAPRTSLVHHAARGRLQHRAARRLDRGAGRALHIHRPEGVLGRYFACSNMCWCV